MLWQWCAAIAIASGIGRAQHPSVPISDLLVRRVPAYRVQNEPRLNALVRFGRENGIPLGIEFSTTELDDTVNVSTPATDVWGVLSSILGVTRQYSLASARGVVSIRAVDVPPPAWLDHRVRRFRLPRTQISWASMMLWMTVETIIDPAKKGFAGDYPPGDPNDRVGPMDVRDVTVRELLNRIVGASGHSSWIVTRQGARILGPASINRLWTTMYRTDPLSQLPGPPLPRVDVR
jgi:hypothetical protein